MCKVTKIFSEIASFFRKDDEKMQSEQYRLC